MRHLFDLAYITFALVINECYIGLSLARSIVIYFLSYYLSDIRKGLSLEESPYPYACHKLRTLA